MSILHHIIISIRQYVCINREAGQQPITYQIKTKLKTSDFTTTLLVDQPPGEVFKAIKNVRGWWSGLYEEEFEGTSDKLQDEFSFRAGGGAHYSKQKLIELMPNKKIVWLVTDSELTFLEDPREWIGTRISFEISEHDTKTKIVFSHVGLTPEIECFDSCTSAWSQYIHQCLKKWIAKTQSALK